MKNKYSDWFKVDLHIHTDFSNQTKPNDYDGTFDISVLKSKLIKNDVKLFSLTDHNIINSKAYEDYYNSFSEGDPILLVGCEFDIKVKQNDGSFLTYHTLLIFNENNTIKANEISNIIETHFATNGIDMKDRNLTIDQVFELFSSYQFFYIPHAAGHKNIIEAYKPTNIAKAQEMVLLMECAHEKVKEKSTQIINAGFDKLKEPDFQNKEDEAFINFSDNHNCNIYPTPKSGTPHEFYCLKGEPTYETLRFACIDPLSRIRKQTDVDLLKNVNKYISSIKIENIKDVENCEIEFSPNLNAIIGGASSGKSLLFNLIGKKIENNKHKFNRYHKEDLNSLIKASNSQNYQNSLHFNSDEIIYINQGDIVNYFEEGDLTKLVKESEKNEELTIAEENIKSRRSQLSNEFDDFNNSYHQDFSIQEGDFENMLSDSFYFVEINSAINTIDFEEKDNLLNKISSNTETLREDKVFEFLVEEIELIEQFERLILEKKELIQLKKNLQMKRVSFINDVNQIIRQKNSQLNSTSRAKNASIERRNNLITSCNKLFKSASKFNRTTEILQNYEYQTAENIEINESVKLTLEVENNINLSNSIIGCLNFGHSDSTIYINYLGLVKDNSQIKNYNEYSKQILANKIISSTNIILEKFNSPTSYLDYGVNGNSKNKSPGYNSEMYLKTILQQENCKLVMIDQPEDNLGNSFKNEDLIKLLRDHKFKKQIIIVTHNPSIVVYGDSENIILAKNENEKISYEQLVLERKENQELIIDNLDGGKYIFDMRSRKYNIKKLLNS
ncbi:hypothetical protein [Algibacter luteus]|uniref:Polymerase/histidinol phosphatase N-terminal domain-containing protein n=1 Tax=Algibacter luteus TaxID=1178825 RepID=A0A1M6EMM4_9FLAO|nr:hypothetical protein [Algibacter luteus]SHI86787.1 hypothetical protein SAMN05216261_2059 [Algibacter luteus]